MADPQALHDLLPRLEAASGADRELDAEIAGVFGQADIGWAVEAFNYKDERLVLIYREGWNDGGIGTGYWWEEAPRRKGKIFPSKTEANDAAKGARGFNWAEPKPESVQFGTVMATPPPAYTASRDACAALQAECLQGWNVSHDWLGDINETVTNNQEIMGAGPFLTGCATHHNPCLAWLIAIVRAVLADNREDKT